MSQYIDLFRYQMGQFSRALSTSDHALDLSYAQLVRDVVDNVWPKEKTGIAPWFTERIGKHVNLIQVTSAVPGKLKEFMPGPRVLREYKSGEALLGDSLAGVKGCRIVYRDGDLLAVQEVGGFNMSAIYWC